MYFMVGDCGGVSLGQYGAFNLVGVFKVVFLRDLETPSVRCAKPGRSEAS